MGSEVKVSKANISKHLLPEPEFHAPFIVSCPWSTKLHVSFTWRGFILVFISRCQVHIEERSQCQEQPELIMRCLHLTNDL